MDLSIHFTHENIHHTSDLMRSFPEGVILVILHNKPVTVFHFDQAGPCHLTGFDEQGIHSGTHQVSDGRGALFTQIAQGRYFMFAPGLLDPAEEIRSLTIESLPMGVIDAYLNTRYLVKDMGIEIRIGYPEKSLDRLLKETETKAWAYITAWNPGSELLTEEENEKRHQELIKALQEYQCYEGQGVGIDTDWPPEKSLLVLGIEENKAIELGKAFCQNAIVTGTLDTLPRLRILID